MLVGGDRVQPAWDGRDSITVCGPVSRDRAGLSRWSLLLHPLDPAHPARGRRTPGRLVARLTL